MDSRNMEKALELYAALIMGEEVKQTSKEYGSLYEEYVQNAEVYDIVNTIIKKMNLNIYEYHDALFVTAGEGNRVFGYTNEELKRAMNLRLNKELYLCYYIMYEVILAFYQDSASYQFREYVKLEEIVEAVRTSFSVMLKDLSVYAMEELEENSFKTLALMWDELPAATREDQENVRASRASRLGYTKQVFKFLVAQTLCVELEERYYPTDRLKALAENYFEEYRGRIYELLGRSREDA